MQHDTVAAGCARNAKRFHKPGCGFYLHESYQCLYNLQLYLRRVERVRRLRSVGNTRGWGGGHAALSDTSALSHYSLVSVAVCRKLVISIKYNYNELDSSEISMHSKPICVGYMDSSFHDNVGKNKDEDNGIRIPRGIYGLEISDSPMQHVMIGAMPLHPTCHTDQLLT